jgi:hypothetical protein
MAITELEGWFIVLSQEQAEQVRGKSTPFAALEPRKIEDGRFILGTQVLDDPAHAKHIPFLATLPQCKLIRETDDLPGPPGVSGRYSILRIVPGSEVPGDPSRLVKPPYVPLTGTQPWAAPPKPAKGDWSDAALYESIGRALSAWESFEVLFAQLFAAFLSPTTYYLPIERAYGSILTFRGRSGMVAAAGAAYFLAEPEDEIEKADQRSELKHIINLSDKYSGRRNEIAHGMVGEYSAPDGPVRGLALLPPPYAERKNTLHTELDARINPYHRLTSPAYAYTTAEINYFAERFRELRGPTSALQLKVARVFALPKDDV